MTSVRLRRRRGWREIADSSRSVPYPARAIRHPRRTRRDTMPDTPRTEEAPCPCSPTSSAPSCSSCSRSSRSCSAAAACRTSPARGIRQARITRQLRVLAGPDHGEGRSQGHRHERRRHRAHAHRRRQELRHAVTSTAVREKADHHRRARQVHLLLHDPQLHDRHDRGEMSTELDHRRSASSQRSDRVDAVERHRHRCDRRCDRAPRERLGALLPLLPRRLPRHRDRRGARPHHQPVVRDQRHRRGRHRGSLILGLRYRALLLPPRSACGSRWRRSWRTSCRAPAAPGFKETATTTEAVVGMVAEAVHPDPRAGRAHGTASAATSSTLNT